MARSERDKKFKQLYAFAKSIPSRIKGVSEDVYHADPQLLHDLQEHIYGLRALSPSMTAAKADETDALSSEIWNLAIRWNRQEANSGPPAADFGLRKAADGNRRTICLLRAFAFFLIDLSFAQQPTVHRQLRSRTRTRSGEAKQSDPSKQGRGEKLVRLLKVGLKAAKFCLDTEELDLCSKVVERVAAAVEEAGDPMRQESDDADIEVKARLRMEYFVMRTALAWKQGRMDIAEHMFTQSAVTERHLLTPQAAEQLADVLFEMGREFLKNKKYSTAVRWLERSYSILGDQQPDQISADSGELKLSIQQSLVRALLAIGDEPSYRRAADLVELMETDYVDKLVVSLLRLEVLSKAPALDNDLYYSVILKIMRSAVMSQKVFRTIIYHVRQLKHEILACKALDDFIELRLLSADSEEYLEKAFTARIFITTKMHEHPNLEQLQEVMDLIWRNTKKALGTASAHASQTLMWKRVELAYSQAQLQTTEAWCRLCLHDIFEKCGEVNKAKISRKLMLCALSRQDYVAIRKAFYEMSESSRAAPLSQYLMYRAAIRSGDAESASECLEAIFQRSSEDATILYACVLEAQQAGQREQGALAFQKLIERFDSGRPEGIHLPALLRCTTRILITSLKKESQSLKDVEETLCKSFEYAAEQAKKQRRPVTDGQACFAIGDLQWFSKNAYNICVQYCDALQPAQLSRLLAICLAFIELLREDHNLPKQEEEDLVLRHIFCEFLAASTSVTLARAEDSVQVSLQHYLAVRKHGEKLRELACDQLSTDRFDDATREDLVAKHFHMINLELEAVLMLEKWDELNGLFEECWKYDNPGHWGTLADLVLVIQSRVSAKPELGVAYQEKLLTVLERIINITWREDRDDVERLARWIRCLFQISFTFNEATSLKCMDQAIAIAKRRQAKPGATPYPADEIEWLAAFGFNRAVDYFSMDDRSNCCTWAEKAISLAGLLDDGGALKNTLVSKYSGLVWDEK